MKKMMKLAFVAAIAAVAGYNVYQSQSVMNGMSDFALANVEALADGESNGSPQQCYQVFTPADWFHSDQVFVDCYTCTQKKGRNFDKSRECYKQ